MPNPEPAEIETLKERAEQALAARQRPVFVEFSGSPKSGKSTCIDAVSHFFRRTGYSVLAPAEGASKRTPYFLRSDLVAFNTWSATYALTHVLEGIYQSDKYDLAILDRGLFDALSWFEFLKMEGKISKQDAAKVQDFIRINKWRSVIDAVFIFTTDPGTSMSRENTNTLIDRPGSTMNLETLEKLKQSVATARTSFAHEFKNIIDIDTSDQADTSPKSTAALVTDHIINLFSAKQLQ